jgi:hypothetical protein
VLLPTWLAVIEQMPAATVVSVLPDTVQTPVVVDAKLTARFDEAVAESSAVVPTVLADGCANVMFWLTKLTAND